MNDDRYSGWYIHWINKQEKKTRADYIQHHLIIFLFVPVSMAGEQQTNNRSRIMSTHYVYCWQVHVIYIWNKQKVWRYKKMEPFAMQLMWDISIFFWIDIFKSRKKKKFFIIIWKKSKKRGVFFSLIHVRWVIIFFSLNACLYENKTNEWTWINKLTTINISNTPTLTTLYIINF